MRDVNKIKEYREILGNHCINCNSTTDIEYHHIVPLIAGGIDDIRNIVPLCRSCHFKSHSKVWHSTSNKRQGRKRKIDDSTSEIYIRQWLNGKISSYELCDKLMIKHDNRRKAYDCYNIRSVKEYMDRNGILKDENRMQVGKIRRGLNKRYREENINGR